MKTMVTGSKFVPGKVVVGPRAIGRDYYRIVSQRDRSGRIEVFDRASRSWNPAPEDIAFIDVWRAPEAVQLFVDLAWARSLEGDDEEAACEAAEAPLPPAPPPAGEPMGAS